MNPNIVQSLVAFLLVFRLANGEDRYHQSRWESFYRYDPQPLALPEHRFWSAPSAPDFWKSVIFAKAFGNDSRSSPYSEPKSATTFTGKYTDIECKGDQECHKTDVTLSCMGASPRLAGRCMPPLRPMEHGCVFDDQCQKTCQESFCATEPKFKNFKGESQCRCRKGYYYLWKKCWNNCLPGTLPVRVDDDHWVCQEIHTDIAKMFIVRNKRSAQRRLAC